MATRTTIQGMFFAAVLGCSARTTTGEATALPDAGQGQGSDATLDAAAPGTPSITMIDARVLDERADTIDFSSGDPVHTHHGASIDLSTGCPDVYLYGYLTGEAAPTYGGETSPNELAWRLTASSPTSIALTYRVRTDDGRTVLDWVALPSDASGTYAIALHSDGAHAVRELATRDGGMWLDVRIHDTLGQETTTTFCWKHHPLAAPLELQPIAKEAAGEALFAMTLSGAAPISDVLQDHGVAPSLVGQQIVQHTAEPIALDIAVAPPTGSFTKTVAVRFAPTGSGTLACGTSEAYSTDPRCQVTAFTTDSLTASSGALGSARFAAAVLDLPSRQPAAVCTVTGLHASCTIPPRLPGEAPHAYRVIVTATDVVSLWPASTGPFAEHLVNGATYTGLAPVPVSKCTTRGHTVDALGVAHYSCAYTTYAHIVALDQAQLAFAAFGISYKSSIGPAAPMQPLASTTSPAWTWDAGVEVLP